MRRSKEDSEQTRAAILDAAARMFCEKGYAATTVESISRAAGVTRGAFYWHFRDKSDVLGALHGRSFLPQERFLTAAIESGAEDPLGCVFDVALAALRSFEVNQDEQRIFRIMSDLTIGEEGHETLARIHAEMRALIRRIMQQARDKGTLHPGVTPAEAELALTVTIGGLLAEWLRSDKSFPLADFGAKLLRGQRAMLQADPGDGFGAKRHGIPPGRAGPPVPP